MKNFKISFNGEIIVIANDEEEAFAEAYERLTSNPFRYMELEEK